MIFRTAVFTLLFVIACATNSALSQDNQNHLTPEEQAEVVEALIGAIDELYLYQDRVPKLAEKLRESLKSGVFKESNKPYLFATKLTDQLRSFTSDLHFGVRHGSRGSRNFGGFRFGDGGSSDAGTDDASSADSTGGSRRVLRIGAPGVSLDPDSPMFKMLHEQFRKNNFSMPKLEVLPGNVGYMRLDMMPPLDVARPTLDAAMTFLSNTDAMIIDVRDTPGGVGGFIPYFMSFFFPEGGKLLFTRYFGADDRSDRFLTEEKLGAIRRPDVPLYVLTSSATGSAAENLAFTLKNHDRAKTVGETTRGGGHSARMAPLVHGFMASIPAANVIHPETGKGFDGVGVAPSVSVAAGDALDKAHELALESLIKTASEADREQLTTTLGEIRAARQLKNGKTGEAGDAMKAYAGVYGVRKVFIEDGKLRYQREGGPALELRPLGNDTFRMATPPSMRSAMELPNVRFERNEIGSVKGFSLVRKNGEVEAFVERRAD